MPPLILASASPRRRQLLNQIGLAHRVWPADLDEAQAGSGIDGNREPAAYCRVLAAAKAQAVAELARAQGEPALVLAADTVVWLPPGTLLGKPADQAGAERMLAGLNGREHRVFTSIALIDAGSGRTWIDHQETRVTMRALTPAQIRAYVQSGEPLDKAGAYAVQGLGSILIERIDGCYTNVVGLPLPKLARLLEEAGLPVL